MKCTCWGGCCVEALSVCMGGLPYPCTVCGKGAAMFYMGRRLNGKCFSCASGEDSHCLI